MKVYGCPEELPSPNFNWDDIPAYEKACDDHRAALKAWLQARGFTGPNTGECATFPVADGHAEYMLGEAVGRKASILIHLDYWDGYQFREAQYLPKKEIIANAQRRKNLAKLIPVMKLK